GCGRSPGGRSHGGCSPGRRGRLRLLLHRLRLLLRRRGCYPGWPADPSLRGEGCSHSKHSQNRTNQELSHRYLPKQIAPAPSPQCFVNNMQYSARVNSFLPIVLTTPSLSVPAGDVSPSWHERCPFSFPSPGPLSPSTTGGRSLTAAVSGADS